MDNLNLYIAAIILLFLSSCGGVDKGKETVSYEEKTACTKDIQDSQKQTSETTAAVTDSEAIKMLKEFYSACLSHSSPIDSDSYGKYLTKAMQERVWKMGCDYDMDPIIRAQDVPEDSCESLKIEALDNDWYMVSYEQTFEDKSTHNRIPVKVVREDGELRIGYIVPDYLGQTYGDSLWYSADTFPTVDRSRPLDFVRSFYEFYMAKSGSLSVGLSQELATVRTEYLTDKALKQFSEAEEHYLQDGCDGYDLLLNKFNFEYPCHSSLKVTPLKGESAYYVSYRQPYGSTDTLRIEVVKQEGKYYIDGIYDRGSEHFRE